ncbi:hypothetical protein [Bradyrhizobium sp. ORS 86]|uniref:hypothetical protein n=1 Tax=Bradyrhizobium sp. ORS 86 TaxID=1685970 RepID=UPI00388DEF33
MGYGGCVDGEDHLVCLFHAFAYDKQGACARTGRGDRPRRVSLGHRRPAHEVNGLLYMWHRHTGSPPA